MKLLINDSILEFPQGIITSDGFKIFEATRFSTRRAGVDNGIDDFIGKVKICMNDSCTDLVPGSDYIAIMFSSDSIDSDTDGNMPTVDLSLLEKHPSILLYIHINGEQMQFHHNPYSTSLPIKIVCVYDQSAILASLLLHNIESSEDFSPDDVPSIVTTTFRKCTRPKPDDTITFQPQFSSSLEWIDPHLQTSQSFCYLKYSAEEYLSLTRDSSGYCLCACSMRRKVLAFQKFVDILLGMLMVWLVFLNVDSITDLFRINAQVTANATLRLLDILMNNPGGLKLNHGLAIFLGKFYTYHVWLWAEYIRLMVMYSTPTLKILVTVGSICGFTFQISLLQDLISVLTMHLVCFYIYSARLYSLCINSMLMLWRLFRGKKWNVLRERVDSAGNDLEQLFIGTLLFTMALFLMPTVLVYYLVFGSFYIVLSAVHLLLQRLQSVFRYNYILVHLLLLFKSSKLTTNGSLEVVENDDPNLTVLKYRKLKMASYLEVVSILSLPQSKPSTSVSSILSNFVLGSPISSQNKLPT